MEYRARLHPGLLKTSLADRSVFPAPHSVKVPSKATTQKRSIAPINLTDTSYREGSKSGVAGPGWLPSQRSLRIHTSRADGHKDTQDCVGCLSYNKPSGH